MGAGKKKRETFPVPHTGKWMGAKTLFFQYWALPTVFFVMLFF
jgi:hypothetical protein